MLKSEVITLFKNLNSLTGLRGVKFSYAVAKNLNILKSEIESLQKSIELSEEFQKYEVKRIELVKKHADKDDKGNPKQEEKDGMMQYVVIINEKVFNKEFESLKKGHKKVLDERQKQIDEYTELLTTESKVEIHRIKLGDVPQDITTDQMTGIYDVIDEK